MPDVSVIIVTWNSAGCIASCLESLQRHGSEEILEIIVVDNGSSDETVSLIADQYPEVRLLLMGANLGFPKANNLAAAQANGQYLFFLNPDARLENTAIALLRTRLVGDEQLGIVGPSICDEAGHSVVVDARSFPSLRNTCFRYLGLRTLFPGHPVFGAAYLHPSKRVTSQEVECLTGAAMFMEAARFHAVGGFDDELPMYFEDMDLCGKVNATGKRCGYEPAARVTHLGGESAALSPIARFLLALEDGQAPWMYFRRYRSLRTAQTFTLVLALGNLFRIMLYVLALPLAVNPHIRKRLFTRFDVSFTMLRWCISSKSRCIQEARARFDAEPVPFAPDKAHERG